MSKKTQKQFNILIKTILVKDFGVICSLEITSILQIIVSTMQPIILLRLIDSAIEIVSVKKIIILALIYLFFSVMSCLLYYLQQIISIKWRLKFERYIRDSLLKSMLHSKRILSAGDIDTLLLKDVSEIEEYILFILVEFPKTIISGIFLFITITIINYKLTLVILFLNLLILFFQRIINIKIASNSIKLRDNFSGFYGSISEISNNIMNAKDLGAGNYIINLCNSRFDRVAKFLYENIKLNSILGAILELLGGIIIIFIVSVGCIFLYFKTITVGTLFSFVQYSGQVHNFFNSLIQLPVQKANNTAIVSKMIEILFCEKEDICTISESELSKFNKVTEIKIFNLSFSYQEGRKKIFDSLNCTFECGKINVVWGQSGSGKTTLFRLLLRKEIQENGNIRINNIVIDEYSREDVLKFIGYLPQEDIIFNDTIRNNVLVDREYSEEKLFEVCKICNIHDEINVFENGYDTILTPENLNISGGQIKRLLLARLLLDDKKILLLDEPTSSLDFESVEKFMKVIQNLLGEKLIIIITHDLSINKYPINSFKLNERKIERQ